MNTGILHPEPRLPLTAHICFVWLFTIKKGRDHSQTGYEFSNQFGHRITIHSNVLLWLKHRIARHLGMVGELVFQISNDSEFGYIVLDAAN